MLELVSEKGEAGLGAARFGVGGDDSSERWIVGEVALVVVVLDLDAALERRVGARVEAPLAFGDVDKP